MSKPLDALGLPIVGDYLLQKGKEACGHDEVGLVIFMHDNVTGDVVCTTNFPPNEFDTFMQFVGSNDYTTEKHSFDPIGKAH